MMPVWSTVTTITLHFSIAGHGTDGAWHGVIRRASWDIYLSKSICGIWCICSFVILFIWEIPKSLLDYVKSASLVDRHRCRV